MKLNVKPHTVELENVDTGDNSHNYYGKDRTSDAPQMPVHSALYVKDKFCVSNEAYHEMSMLSNLPSSFQVNKVVRTFNSQYEISNSPNNIVGVQQKLRKRLAFHIAELSKLCSKSQKPIPSTIRVKLKGDGTQIARGLSVVNFAFTILEEGGQECSVKGNHTITILKVSEDYNDLAAGLKDIIEEAKDLEVITVEDRVYKIEYFLGGDWKFLACVSGIEAATCDFACIWCKCPRSQRWNMSMIWSLTDLEKGARTVKEISQKCQLAKTSKNHYNCC